MAGRCPVMKNSDYADVLITSMAEMPGLVLTWLLIDRLGRRRSQVESRQPVGGWGLSVGPSAHTDTHTRSRARARTHTHTHTHTQTHARRHTQTHTDTHTHTHTHVCVPACAYYMPVRVSSSRVLEPFCFCSLRLLTAAMAERNTHSRNCPASRLRDRPK